MSSRAASLVATVIADLRRVRQEAARRDASHSTPPVALPVALPNSMESKGKATEATRATSNGQTPAIKSESWSVRQDDEHTAEKEFSLEYLSESVASVARVAFIEDNQRVDASHMDRGCGSCGSSTRTTAGGSDQSCSVQPFDGLDLALAEMEGVPEEWLTGLASMARMAAPAGITPTDWEGFVAGATRLLENWGAQLAALGWTTADLFAVHRFRPTNRNDCAGLVRFVGHNDVRAVTATTVTLRTASGATQTFYRRTPSDSDWVLMWELGDRSRRA